MKLLHFIHFALILLPCLAASPSFAQDFADDFDDGDLEGWSAVLQDGDVCQVAAVSSYAHSPEFSLHTWRNTNPLLVAVERDEFLANSGTYQAWILVSNEASNTCDAALYFCRVDDQNFYAVSCKPLGSDNPGYSLQIRENGSWTNLDTAPSTFSFNEWVLVSVDRHGNGDMQVFVNGELTLSTSDATFSSPGKFAVGAWKSAYFDDVEYRAQILTPVQTSTHPSVLKSSSYPNPFNPTTWISFDLPASMVVDLSVYDHSGRLVRELLAGQEVSEGRNGVEWDGQDIHGKLVSSGVYFYRLDAGPHTASGRIVLLK